MARAPHFRITKIIAFQPTNSETRQSNIGQKLNIIIIIIIMIIIIIIMLMMMIIIIVIFSVLGRILQASIRLHRKIQSYLCN